MAPPSCSPLLDAGLLLNEPATSTSGSWMEIHLKYDVVLAEKMRMKLDAWLPSQDQEEHWKSAFIPCAEDPKVGNNLSSNFINIQKPL